jgi:hypothetical protein
VAPHIARGTIWRQRFGSLARDPALQGWWWLVVMPVARRGVPCRRILTNRKHVEEALRASEASSISGLRDAERRFHDSDHSATLNWVPARFPDKHRVAVCGNNLNCVELLSMLSPS